MKKFWQKVNKKIKNSTKKLFPDAFDRKVEILVLKIMAIGIASIALVAAIFSYYNLAYQNKIFPHVQVAGINMAGYSQNEVAEILADKNKLLIEEKITIKYQDQIYQPKLKELGVSFDISKAVNEAYYIGRGGSDLQKIKYRVSSIFKKQEIEFEPNIDQTVLNKFFDQIAKKIYKAPVNAQIVFEEGNAKMIPAVFGQKLDLDHAKQILIEKIRTNDKSELALNITQIKPEITDDVASKVFPQAQKISNLTYTLTANIPGQGIQKYYAKPKLIANWVQFVPKEGQLFMMANDVEIVAYIKRVARYIDVSPIDTQITLQNGQKKILMQGTPGRIMDRQPVYRSLKDSVLSLEPKEIAVTVTEKPPAEVEVGTAMGGRFPGKYVEIVLSTRTLYCFEGMNQTCAFKISPGRPSMPTPYGLFTVLRKLRSVKCQPNPEYKTCVMPYTMSFTPLGHAIHELPIIDGRREGVSHLGRAVSHGCVRLGIGPAELIWNWGEVGMPVYVHR